MWLEWSYQFGLVEVKSQTLCMECNPDLLKSGGNEVAYNYIYWPWWGIGVNFVLIWLIWAFRFMWLSCSHSTVNREGLPAFNWILLITPDHRICLWLLCIYILLTAGVSNGAETRHYRNATHYFSQSPCSYVCNVFTLMVWCLYRTVGEFRRQYIWRMP